MALQIVFSLEFRVARNPFACEIACDLIFLLPLRMSCLSRHKCLKRLWRGAKPERLRRQVAFPPTVGQWSSSLGFCVISDHTMMVCHTMMVYHTMNHTMTVIKFSVFLHY